MGNTTLNKILEILGSEDFAKKVERAIWEAYGYPCDGQYDYPAAVAEDIITAVEDDMKYQECVRTTEEYNELLFICDNVTGNASGSYTMNAWKAEEYVAHNWEMLADAMSEFGCDVSVLEKGAEWADVTIRCYLVSGCLAIVLQILAEELGGTSWENAPIW